MNNLIIETKINRMKDIVIAYTKEQKSIAKKLSSKLEGAGYSCWVEPRDLKAGEKKEEAYKQAVENCKLVVLVYSDNSNKSEDLMTFTDIIFDYDVSIVPFITTDVNITVAIQYFLIENNWIDAFDKSFDEACDDLFGLIKDEFSGEIVQQKKSRNKDNNRESSSPLKNQTNNNILIGIGVIIIVVIGILLFQNDDEPGENEETLVGEWILEDYSDNMIRTKQDSIEYIKSINTLKQNFLLIFKDDNTFERHGFQPQPEFGNWEYDESKKILFLQGRNSESKDMITLQELTENRMIIVIAEKLENGQVITKLTLTKR